MPDLSPKARFDALAAMFGFGAGDVAAIRDSLARLSSRVTELARVFDGALKRPAAQALFPGVEGERAGVLQALAAGFILRTVGCNFDEAYCDYVAEIAARQDVPAGFVGVALAVAQDFVLGALPGAMHGAPDKLAPALMAWGRLFSILKLMT